MRIWIMNTPTNYIAKDINLVHGPTNYTYTPNFGVGLDMKWTEGTWSKSGVLLGGDIFKDSSSCGVPATKADNSSPPASYINERYSSLDYLKKESIASGLNEMNTNVSFSGVADYRITRESFLADPSHSIVFSLHADTRFLDEPS